MTRSRRRNFLQEKLNTLLELEETMPWFHRRNLQEKLNTLLELQAISMQTEITLREQMKGQSMEEKDPNGKATDQPGAKLDEGKVDLTFLNDWSLALAAVCRVAEFGAKKYSRGGWQWVPDGVNRYTKAMLRHLFRQANDDGFDHDIQALWNDLSRVELKLRQQRSEQTVTSTTDPTKMVFNPETQTMVKKIVEARRVLDSGRYRP